jgi:hypothetical protein
LDEGVHDVPTSTLAGEQSPPELRNLRKTSLRAGIKQLVNEAANFAGRFALTENGEDYSVTPVTSCGDMMDGGIGAGGLRQ